MRISRLGIKKNKNKKRNLIMFLFVVLIPCIALAASMLVTNIIYKKQNTSTISKSNNPTTSQTESEKAFKYNFDISSKKLYRLQLGKFNNYEEASKLLKSIKRKKLSRKNYHNAFIVKSNGYMVLYGYFKDKSTADEAAAILKKVKVETEVEEVSFSSYSLNGMDMDGRFLNLVKETDSLINDIINAKCESSHKLLMGGNINKNISISNIIQLEDSLKVNLTLMWDMQVSEELMDFKTKYMEALKNINDNILKKEDIDFFKIQNSLIYQIESYNKLMNELAL